MSNKDILNGETGLSVRAKLNNAINRDINQTSTSIITGGEITVASGTTVDIAALTIRVVDNHTDPTNPTYNEYTYGPFAGVVITNLATQERTHIAIDSAGTLYQTLEEPMGSTLRDRVVIGVVGHGGGAVVQANNKGALPGFNSDLNYFDLAQSIGFINQGGNDFSAAATNLTIKKSAGSTFYPGISYIDNKKSPNAVDNAAIDPVTFTYTYRDGAGGKTLVTGQTAIIPGSYDDGDGTLGSVSTNNWSVQRIAIIPKVNAVIIGYGQATYNSVDAAKESLNTEPFESYGILDEEVSFRCWLIVRGGATNLSDSGDAVFVNAGKFGEGALGGFTGAGAQSLQSAYNNSTNPEITVDATRGAVSIQDNPTPLGANLFEVQSNGGGTTYFAVDESGVKNKSLTVDNQIVFGGNRQLTSELKKAKNLFDPQSFREGHAVVNGNINPLAWVDTGSVLPQVLRLSHSAIIGDYVYLFGGWDGADENKIFRAPLTDPVAGWVDTGGVLPQVLRSSQPAIIGDYLYLFGGDDGVSENKIFRTPLTDPVTGWVDTGSVLPQVLKDSQVVIISDYVYLFGGSDGADENKIFRAPLTDPVSGWVDTGGTLPQVLRLSHSAIIGEYVYLFGGYDGVEENKIFRAPLTDPVTGWVDTGSVLPQVLRQSHLAIIGDYVYLFGGGDGADENKIFRAPLTDPVAGWVDTGSVLPQVLRESQLAIIGDHAYLFGGNDGADENKIFRTKLGVPDDFTLSGATLNAKNLPTYADDSAAGTGGLVQGDIYLTATGELRIKL